MPDGTVDKGFKTVSRVSGGVMYKTRYRMNPKGAWEMLAEEQLNRKQ